MTIRLPRAALAGLLVLLHLAAPAWGKAPRRTRSDEGTERLFARVYRFQARGWHEARREIDRRLRQPRLDKATAVAAVLYLMDYLGLRVGSRRYEERPLPEGEPAPRQKSFGPTFGASSLHKQHVRIEGDTVVLSFVGKSGVGWRKVHTDPRLAATLRLFLAQEGERLFQVPGPRGTMIPVTEDDVREFLAPLGALPKDYRTLHANRIFRETLGRELSEAQAVSGCLPTIDDGMVDRAVDAAATFLNHEAPTCRKNYLDPRQRDASQLDAALLIADWEAARRRAN